MKGFIYKITNLINGKIYIGQTTCSIEDRWKEHLHSAKKSVSENRPLYRAINKYGKENFSIEKIEELPINLLCEREVFLD